MKETSFKLTITSPTQTYTYNSADKSIVIGRSLKCSFNIPREDLSREHCLLELKDNEIYITDLDSKNGITVDQVRIPSQIPTQITPSSFVVLSKVYILKLNLGEDRTKSETDALRTTVPEISMITDLASVEKLANHIKLQGAKEKRRKQLLTKANRSTKENPLEYSNLRESIKMVIGFIVIVAAMLYHALGK
jgi:pSer/pThr/pTyr-binding forkhead associated (FHA) protein